MEEAGLDRRHPRWMWWALFAFTAGYLLAAGVGAVVTGNREFGIYLGVLVVMAGVVGALHWQVGLTLGLLWMLSGLGGLHMAGGLVPVPGGWPHQQGVEVLYGWWVIPGWLRFDQIVHGYGYGVATWVIWQLLRKGIGKRAPGGWQPRPTLVLVVICAAASTGFGALNEVVEFFAKMILPETNVGGYTNTGWDLVFNATGAAVAGALVWLGVLRK